MPHFDIIVFDTETTGLIENSAIPLVRQPSIIELCAIKLRFDPEAGDFVEGADELWESLFHHGPLSDETTKITGITTQDVACAPKFASRIDDLAEFFLGARAMVGHNLSYDRDMLELELRRLGRHTSFPWPPRHICTVEESETITGFRLGLNDLHERLLGHRFLEHHRAKPDTQATTRCFIKLVHDGIIRL